MAERDTPPASNTSVAVRCRRDTAAVVVVVAGGGAAVRVLAIAHEAARESSRWRLAR